ncbi:MAG: ChrR family anti-sigma-E factor [Pseudomonadota bacterium]
MTMHGAPMALLTDYASGSATPGLSLLVASHLTYAPSARAKVAEMERLGGALLRDAKPRDVGSDLLARTLGKLDHLPCARAEARVTPRHTHDDELDRMPAPLRRALNGTAPRWRFRLPGVSEAVLDSFEGEHVSLLRARPGAKIPQHTHEGREVTLVMQGALADGDRVFKAGDVAVNDEDDDHHPSIVGEETCVCLIVMEGSLRFTGRFSRALNLLGE